LSGEIYFLLASVLIEACDCHNDMSDVCCYGIQTCCSGSKLSCRQFSGGLLVSPVFHYWWSIQWLAVVRYQAVVILDTVDSTVAAMTTCSRFWMALSGFCLLIIGTL